MPSPNICMNSCYTDPYRPGCSCDIEPCDIYTFVNNIWFTKDDDTYWEDPGYVNFSISWYRSTRPDDYVPENGVCGSTPSPTNVYQGSLGDFKIVLDQCNGLWGQEVQIGTDGDTITFGGWPEVTNPEHLNSLILTRVLPNWSNSGGYVMSYDNISPNSIENGGIYGGVNNQLIGEGSCASAVIVGQSQKGLAGDSMGSIPGDVLAQVRAKFHGGSTGGFDTKFQPAFQEETENANMCGLTDEFGDTLTTYRCWPANGIFEYIPGACGYLEGTYGMGGICSTDAGCSDSGNGNYDYQYHSYFLGQWGEIQGTSGTGGTTTDFDGITHYAKPMDIVQSDIQSHQIDTPPLDDVPDTWVYVDDDTDAFLLDELAQQCYAGIVPPRRHCQPIGNSGEGYCTRGIGYDGDDKAWRCGGLTEPNTHDYCISAYCDGDESNCPVSVLTSGHPSDMNTFFSDTEWQNAFTKRVRYEDCRQGNYDCISSVNERKCANPHLGGDDSWCYDWEHPWGSSDLDSWPVSGVGFPNNDFTFNIVENSACLPDDLNLDGIESVCGTYFHTFSGDGNEQQIGNWAWIKTKWDTRCNHYDSLNNCDGGQCDCLNAETVLERVFGCKDQSACNYCPECVEHLQADCDYGEWYCPILGMSNETYGCKPCCENIPDGYDGGCGNNPGVDCVSDFDGDGGVDCVPVLSCVDLEGYHQWCTDVDPSCDTNTYDECGSCCGAGTNNTDCDNSVHMDCNGVCYGAAYEDTCGTCISADTSFNLEYFNSCAGGQPWPVAEQIAVFGEQICTGTGGVNEECCCGTLAEGQCTANKPYFYYYDQDGDNKPCTYNADDNPVIVSCSPTAPNNYAEGPPLYEIDPVAWDGITAEDGSILPRTGGDAGKFTDEGWDTVCDCALDYWDICGECGGDGSGCADCAGDPAGSARIDDCGNCIKCCTPDEEDICMDINYDGVKPSCCTNTANCTNPVWNTSGCWHVGNGLGWEFDSQGAPHANNYYEEQFGGAPGGRCRGAGWTDGSSAGDWSNKYCECFTWCSTSCGGQTGINGNPFCSSNQLDGQADEDRITGYDYVAWTKNLFDGDWWSGTCTSGDQCGNNNGVVYATKRTFGKNNQIIEYPFAYNASGPGVGNNTCSHGNGEDNFGGYCGDLHAANRDDYSVNYDGGEGKIQAFMNPLFDQPIANYQPALYAVWGTMLNAGSYTCQNGNCTSNFNQEKSCDSRIGRCGVCKSGGVYTPSTGTYIDNCEVCGGRGDTCGGGTETCTGLCYGHSGGTINGVYNAYYGGIYMNESNCDCSPQCTWWRDCCDYSYLNCKNSFANCQIGSCIGGYCHACASDWYGQTELGCADCDWCEAVYGTTDNAEATYSIQGGSLVNHGVKSCTDGGWELGQFLGNNGMASWNWEVDVFCEMVAAMGMVSQPSGGGAQAYGWYNGDELAVGGSGEWCGDWESSNDCCLRKKNPWFYCAVETCCDKVYRASGGQNYCLWYGPTGNDWGADPNWYRGGWNFHYGTDSNGDNWWEPWIPANFADRIQSSHCPVGGNLDLSAGGSQCPD